MGPKGNLKKNDNPKFINPIGIYENHSASDWIYILLADSQHSPGRWCS
jgi:hypothetical protein